jgi:hypothetical protein
LDALADTPAGLYLPEAPNFPAVDFVLKRDAASNHKADAWCFQVTVARGHSMTGPQFQALYDALHDADPDYTNMAIVWVGYDDEGVTTWQALDSSDRSKTTAAHHNLWLKVPQYRLALPLRFHTFCRKAIRGRKEFKLVLAGDSDLIENLGFKKNGS